jgi:hypothetical protein
MTVNVQWIDTEVVIELCKFLRSGRNRKGGSDSLSSSLVVLGFEPRTLHLLGRCSIT